MPYEKSIDDKDYAFSSEYKNIAYTNYDWGKEVLIDEWETKKWTPVYED